MTRPTRHRPVLLRETIEQLKLEAGMIVVDGTLGAAGHSIEIVKRVGEQGLLIGLDRDVEMLAKARLRLAEAGLADANDTLPGNILLKHGSYAELIEFLQEASIPAVDRILVDLGLSSDQLESRERGFGFQTEGPLDMRFDQSAGQAVWEWLSDNSIAEITKYLVEFGEEPLAAEIAERIKQTMPVHVPLSAAQLREVVENVYQNRRIKPGKSHPATRTFQALRIQANAELEHLQRLLSDVAPGCLKPGGRLAVISFHSLEDRMTKQAFQDRAVWSQATKKPITASSLEQKMNPRSRSAKLRIGIRADG